MVSGYLIKVNDMFNLSYMSPCETQGKIQLSKRPSGLGRYTDVHGVEWDINGIVGNFVQACKLDDLHAYYSDTSATNAYGLVQQEWKPYEVEIIE